MLLFIGGFFVAMSLNHDEDMQYRAVLSPTSSLPYASGCRYPNGTRGPCDPNRSACKATIAGAPACDFDGQPRLDTAPVTGCPVNNRIDAGADEFYPPGCEPLVDGTAPVPTTTTMQPPITSPPTTTTAPTFVRVLDTYPAELQKSTLYQKWSQANPVEDTIYKNRWSGIGDTRQIRTAFGKSLEFVIQYHLKELNKVADKTVLNNYQYQLAQSSLYAKWAAANPRENSDIDHYYRGVLPRPMTVRTAFGKSYLLVADARRKT